MSIRRSVRRRVVRVARAAYLGIERSPLAPVLRIPVVQRLKTRVTYMPAAQVLVLLDLVEKAGVRAWVAGGWGVDALAGRQTRRHYDLDLLIGDDPGDLQKVAAALTRADYRLAESEQNPGLAMPWRHFWRHEGGYGVEVLPVALREPPFSADNSFARGSVEGRPVPCLSAALQLTLHSGYQPREIDAIDTRLLHALGEQ
jgi:lincosamide nucleotidyltransferase A/C/D/E